MIRMQPSVSYFLPVLFLVLTTRFGHSQALPLFTGSRWIVNGDGQRVKLACLNWAAHLEPAVAEGLSKQPVDSISRWISSAGFNCVRLTWPLFLVTNGSLGSMTVENSFRGLSLYEPITGIRENNLSFLNLTLLDAFQVNFNRIRTVLLLKIPIVDINVGLGSGVESCKEWLVGDSRQPRQQAGMVLR